MTNSTPIPERKPSSKSWVKNLPFDAAEAERMGCSDECTQEAVWRICRTAVEVDGKVEVPSLEDAAARCLRDFSEFGCHQSLRGLMESLRLWLPWFESKRNNAAFFALAQTQAQIEAEQKGLTPDQVAELTTRNFIAMAGASQDTETYIVLLSLAIKDRDSRAALNFGKRKLEQKDAEIAQKTRALDQSDRRVALLEANAATAKKELSKVASGGGLSPEALKEIERIAKIL